MLSEVSSYSEKAYGTSSGYLQAISRDSFWFSSQAEDWIRSVNIEQDYKANFAHVDVLPPRQNTYQKPVFICETRFDAFKEYRNFGRGELLLVLDCFRDSELASRIAGRFDNVFLLEGSKIAVVHRIPAYGLWQLHVTEDWPYQVSPGTRIFALR